MLKILVTLVGLPGFTFLSAWIYLAQPTLRSSGGESGGVSIPDLEQHVRKLSVDFVPRNAASIGNMNRTADYIKSEFASAGNGVVTEQWFEAGAYRYRNVSLLLGNASEPRVVIGAHYDGYGRYPGADDNASGVAGLIELAQMFAADPPGFAIEFVGYPLEEPPFFGTQSMGSWKHVEELQKRGITCRYMVSLEMIGYFSDEPGSQEYPLPILHALYPDTGNFITVVGNRGNSGLTKAFKAGMKGTTDLPVYSVCGPASIPGIDFSDHRNYWQAGVPAVMVTDTAFYRNKNYHTPRDTIETLDFVRMAKVVEGVYGAIRSLSTK